MGQLTRLQIVTAGQLQGGRDDLATVLNIYFNAWLRSAYMGWPFTFLKRSKTAFALGTGVTSLSFGVGSGGVTTDVQKILDPIRVYDSTYSTKVRARIRQLTGGDVSDDEIVNDPTRTRGVPTQFKVRADSSSWGKWELIPYPVPDKAYLLSFDYLEQPADIDTSTEGDSTIPLYPNDRTMIQAVLSETVKYVEGIASAEYANALEILGSMVVDDRVKYGVVPGDNDLIQLDSNIFR